MIDCVTRCPEKELPLGMEAIRDWKRRNTLLLEKPNHINYADQLAAVHDQA
jgi:hypothetical protein